MPSLSLSLSSSLLLSPGGGCPGSAPPRWSAGHCSARDLLTSGEPPEEDNVNLMSQDGERCEDKGHTDA